MVDRFSNTSEKPDSIDELLDAGAQIAGGVTGTALGLFAAGPAGAFIGGVATPVVAHFLKKAGTEIKNRFLGPREEVRVGATLRFAAAKIQTNLEDGRRIRQDGFFKEQPNDRAPIEEILEGVLLSAQREYEEKKLKFYGNLLANIACNSEIDRAQSNFLIRLGEQLSYRQLCLLSLFANKERFRLRTDDYQELTIQEIGEVRLVLLQEIFDLYSRRIVDSRFNNGHSMGRPLPYLEGLIPSEVYLQGAGMQLYKLMELSQVEQQDIAVIAELLSDKPGIPASLPTFS